MTAKSPAIITAAGAAPPRWRTAWAERENDRRRRAYDTETEAWHRRHDHLLRLRIEAAGFLGCTDPRTGLPVELDDGEVVYRVLPTAELVEAEARHVPGLPAPALTVGPAGVPDRPLPRGLRIVDAGVAVVTDRRVAFAGREHRREWAYADLVGLAHHPDAPLTLLHTADGGRLAGLRVPATAAVNVRFYLTLAVAAASGDRDAVAAQLDGLIDAHHKARPVAPLPLGPEQAPLTALRPERRVATVTAVAAVAFATLTASALASEQVDPPQRVEARVNTAVDPPGVVVPFSRAELGGSHTDAATSPSSATAERAGGEAGDAAPTWGPGTESRPTSVPVAGPTGAPSPPAGPPGLAPAPGPASTTATPPAAGPTAAPPPPS
ncbi:hypothetical protein, partial [Micromonospora deserti]